MDKFKCRYTFGMPLILSIVSDEYFMKVDNYLAKNLGNNDIFRTVN